jgi:hypothetical protein
MGEAHDILAKLRKRLHQLDCQKFKQFDDFEPIIRYIYKHFSPLFPSYRESKSGSRVVYSFNVPGVAPISLEREHGTREHIPHRFAKLAIGGIDDLLIFIESSLPEPEERGGTDDAANVIPAIDIESSERGASDDDLLHDDEEKPT